MMGPEPYRARWTRAPQVILAGRCSDPAPWAGAPCARRCRRRRPGTPARCWNAARPAALPKGHDCLLTVVDRDGIVCEPTNPIRRLHAVLGREPQPARECEPDASYRARRVARHHRLPVRGGHRPRGHVSGMTWTPAAVHVKLEGVERAGYRAITICGTRDPGLIATIDDFLALGRDNVAAKAAAFGVGPTSTPGDPHLRHARRHGGLGAGDRAPRHTNSASWSRSCAGTQDIANAVLVDCAHPDAARRFPGTAVQGGQHGLPLSRRPTSRRAPAIASASSTWSPSTTRTSCSRSNTRRCEWHAFATSRRSARARTPARSW